MGSLVLRLSPAPQEGIRCLVIRTRSKNRTSWSIGLEVTETMEECQIAIGGHYE